MKNKLTLSELRNVIKEEIQFQLTKKQLFENLDKKTLRRILNENVETPVEITKTIAPSENDFPFTVENPNQLDTVITVPAKAFTTNKLQFNMKFILDVPENLKDKAQDITNLFLKSNVSQIFQLTNSKLLIFDYTKVPVITYNNNPIYVKRMELSILYPEATTLPSPQGMGLTIEKVFNFNKFIGKKENRTS